MLLFEMSAKLGHADAQNSLGFMYENGIFVKQDYQEAFKWYSKASEQGLGMAKRNLGLLYFHGSGVEKNYKKAIEFMHEAIECGGLEDGHYVLGRMYLLSNEEKKGIEHLQKSIEIGENTPAKSFLEEYMKKKK